MQVNKANKSPRGNKKEPGRSPTTFLLTTAKVRLFSIPAKKTNDMRKIVKAILAAACIAGIILAGCENPDGSCNLIWTLGFLALALISGYGFKNMEEAK